MKIIIKRKNEKRKKAQEEIVGFVLIIVLVAIIALVFLAISIRKTTTKIESKDLANFLQASLEYTTECERSYEGNYINIQDLITDCYQNQQCLNEKSSCEVLEYTYSGILNVAYPVSENMPTKGYTLDIYYIENSTQTEYKDMLIQIFEGNCTGLSKLGAQQLISAYPGNIVVSLDICKS